MLKTALVALLAVSAARPAAAAAEEQSMDQLVTSLAQERLRGQLGAYKTQWDYWDQFTSEAAASGRAAADKLCDMAFRELETRGEASPRRDLLFRIVQQMLPEAAAPITLVKAAGCFAEKGTIYWLDQAKRNRVEEVYNAILQPSATPEELDSRWLAYRQNTEELTLNTRGVPEAERGRLKEVIYQLVADYRNELLMKQRFKEAPLRKVLLREMMAKKLEKIRHLAEQDVQLVASLLEAAKQPVNSANVRNYLADNAYRSHIIELAKANGAQAIADPELSQLTAAVNASEERARKGTESVADLSGLLTEYGLNADRLITGNISAAEYMTARKMLEDSAAAIPAACRISYSASDIWKYTREQVNRNCEEPAKKFYAGKKQADDNLALRAEELRAALKAITAPLKTTDLERTYKEMQKGFTAPDTHDLRAYAEEINSALNSEPGDPEAWLRRIFTYNESRAGLAEMEALVPRLNGYIGNGRDYTARAAAARREFAARADDFRALTDKQTKAYYELYNKEQALAEYMGLAPYTFSAERAGLDYADAALADRNSFFPEWKIAASREAMPVLSGEAAKLETAVAANKAFLKSAAAMNVELEKLLDIRSPALRGTAGRALFEKYREATEAPLTGKAEAGLAALAQEEPQGYKALTPKQLAAHRAELEALRKAADDLAAAGLEAREAGIRVIHDALKKQYDALKVVSQEAGLAFRKAEEAKKAFTSYPSAASLRGLGDRYAAALEKAGSFGENGGTAPEQTAAEKNRAGAEAREAEVRAFYDRFKTAYESRDPARVAALVADSWSAGDGTSLADLEENLRNNFRLYDEISFNISGLTLTSPYGVTEACYDAAITSRIYKRNLRHEEKSHICDQVRAGEDGGLRITRTTSGSYWYVK